MTEAAGKDRSAGGQEDWQERQGGARVEGRQEEAAQGARAQEITEFNLSNFQFLKGGRFLSVSVCVCRILFLSAPLSLSAELSCKLNVLSKPKMALK